MTNGQSTPGLSREVPIDPAHAALLFIDVQNYCCRPDGGEYTGLSDADRDASYGEFFRTMRDTAVPTCRNYKPHAGRRASRSSTR